MGGAVPANNAFRQQSDRTMAANHGTRGRYLTGCRRDECKNAQALYQRRYRERRANGLTRPASVVVVPPVVEPDGPGRLVESAVTVEIAGLAAEAPRWPGAGSDDD